jgi:hypothetical protein
MLSLENKLSCRILVLAISNCNSKVILLIKIALILVSGIGLPLRFYTLSWLEVRNRLFLRYTKT